jgi:flagellar motor switch protein FliN/FliY
MIRAAMIARVLGTFAKDGDMSATQTTHSESNEPREAGHLSAEKRDVAVRVEVGRVSLSLRQLTQIQDGHVIPLDQAADAPVALFVGDRLVARGQIVLVRDQYCVQLTEIINTQTPSAGN